jgi:outer membrane protein assembly factor BamB
MLAEGRKLIYSFCIRHGQQILRILILILLTMLSILILQDLGSSPVLWAAVPRFGVDDQNSRCIQDSLTKTGFPFKKVWSLPLEGKVESQPIFAQGSIYVQAGQSVYKISQNGQVEAKSPALCGESLPSGSSPTYTWTQFGNRIYQATRDHRLWALDPDTLQPLWQHKTDNLPYLILSAGGQPQSRYRVTSSPMVVNRQGKTWIALGTASGDATGQPQQYADNGFFIIEDQGTAGSIYFSQQMKGEVTGSPVCLDNEVLGTQNSINQPSELIRFDFNTMALMENNTQLAAGIPGSPAVEGRRLYLAERNSRLSCYEKNAAEQFALKWINPGSENEERDRLKDSYNLKSPVIGSRLIYLPIQDYQGSGCGAVIAIDKETGLTHKVRTFASPICANLVAWQPAGWDGLEYLLVLLSDGCAMLLDGNTLEPVYGFIDEAGSLVRQVNLLPQSGLRADPEPIIADNLLLLVDGQGVLHAFSGQGPINFVCLGLSQPSKDTLGSEVSASSEGAASALAVSLQVINQSHLDYDNVPLIIRKQTEADLSGQGDKVPWSNDLFYETTLSLPAGERINLKLELSAGAMGQELLAEINPQGHPEEIVEELQPRSDNRYYFTLQQPICDLELVSLEGPNKGTQGKRETITARVKNVSNNELEQVVLGWYQDGELLRQQTLDFAPGETKVLNWLWQSPNKAGVVQIKAWLDPEGKIPETDRMNNQKDFYIAFNARPSIPDCSNVLEQQSWSAVYSRIIGYQTRQRLDCYASYYGIVQCQTVSWTDYSSPIWESVPVAYSESLQVQATVNTDQGRLTAKDEPQSGDSHSRGAWAIIPYAREHQLDPNEVTRAGYGFSLLVKTQYQTDWERKVPLGLAGTAQPIGGSLSGPTAVIAEFYDTRGDKVSEVVLERTGGTAGVGEATWELPLTSHTNWDGTLIQQRKHFTGADIPDGDYLIIIKAFGAGRNNLNTCKTKKVRIYGTMYDDQYTSLAKSDI